jgi:twitching motility protein PilT
MARIDELLRFLKANGGSDLHLGAGLEPRFRGSGAVQSVPGWSTLSDGELRAMLREIAEERHWNQYSKEHDADFAYGLEGVARFRANYFEQERGAAAVFRIIPEKILTLEQLNVPEVIGRFAHMKRGLVLVTGPTGSGKSTTLAAIINQINEDYEKHIVTIEDPIEFVHPNKKSVLSQREVGAHTGSFGVALKSAMRQDPDVILVGEMRDRETIGLAITAAETGALVFGTLHTNSAAKTIDRLVDAFPADEQDQIRLSLSESLTGIVSQLLLRTADGKGRCACHEVLLRTTALPNLIREGNTPQLMNLIQNSRSVGMRTMDSSLMELVESGKITARDAYMKAQDKAKFEALMPADA